MRPAGAAPMGLWASEAYSPRVPFFPPFYSIMRAGRGRGNAFWIGAIAGGPDRIEICSDALWPTARLGAAREERLSPRGFYAGFFGIAGAAAYLRTVRVCRFALLNSPATEKGIDV